MFYGATGYGCAIVFDIQGGEDSMRLVSRGTVAGFGQFSLEEDDARLHEASRQGNKLPAFRFKFIEIG